LVELLVVMGIIATLAAVAAVGIPAYLRSAHKTACQQNLGSLYKNLFMYSQQYRSFPHANGPTFVLAPWIHGKVDKNQQEAKLFFSPGTPNQPAKDLSNVTPEGIDYTGPDQTGRRVHLTPSMANANAYVIVCNRLPAFYDGQVDLTQFPFGATGINALFAGGAVKWFDTSDDFGGDYPIIGPDSPVEGLQHMVADQY
jgi:type II secretory pathway pseudopilin PulG